ncbi:uncharacterized protein LOC125287227 [Alosa alosa]|uniref:uncharacterized protein LOC125287227 n=1 Tax=Alosa alosa TaxID=278164 RepID=UPI00201530C4|nr:uncharacterized protein LOC125287227 [Alosa alosa]
MTKLQLLNAYLTERLGEVVREILDVVEDTVSEYLEETARTRRENDSLRRQLRDAVLLAKTDLFGPAPADEVSAVRHVEWTPTAHQDPRISPAPPGGGQRLRGEGSEVTAKEEPIEEPLRCPESESLPGRVHGDALTSDPQIKAEPEEADITVTITTDMLSMTPDSAAHTHTLLHAWGVRPHTPLHTHHPPHWCSSAVCVARCVWATGHCSSTSAADLTDVPSAASVADAASHSQLICGDTCAHTPENDRTSQYHTEFSLMQFGDKNRASQPLICEAHETCSPLICEGSWDM